MEVPATTIAIVPHEKFSLMRRSLESVLANTPEPHRIVVVDGGSHRSVAGYLTDQARRHDFTLVRTDYFLRPNEARNLGLRYSRTEFVAFVDNDVVVDPGWLAPLERCARETGAAVVSPLCCIGAREHASVHLTRGECRIVESGGRRVMHERFLDGGRSLDDVLPDVERAQCELVDAHALLVRSAALADGGLDEEIRTEEHIDLALTIRARGGTLWLEPESIVTYITPRRLPPSDLLFYVARWSEAWSRSTLTHLAEKWRLSSDDPWLVEKAQWVSAHRLGCYYGYYTVPAPLRRLSRRWHRVIRVITDRVAQRVAVRHYTKQREKHDGPRVVHAASWLREPAEVRV